MCHGKRGLFSFAMAFFYLSEIVGSTMEGRLSQCSKSIKILCHANISQIL